MQDVSIARLIPDVSALRKRRKSLILTDSVQIPVNSVRQDSAACFQTAITAILEAALVKKVMFFTQRGGPVDV